MAKKTISPASDGLIQNYTQPFDDQDWVEFKTMFRSSLGLDLDYYKENQMRRRISSMARFYRQDSLMGFFRSAKADEELWRKLVDKVTINVSEFFRNPERFHELQKVQFPKILEQTERPTLWCAGCSTGEEPYTLSIIAEEHPRGGGTRIEAMDIDLKILEDARRGIYLRKQLDNVPPGLTNKYFTKLDDERYQVVDALKKRIAFSRFDLLKGSFPTAKYDMILCRNVVIYFTEEAKDKLYADFFKALKPGGVLFIGSTERINNPGAIGLEPLAPFFYGKPKN